MCACVCAKYIITALFVPGLSIVLATGFPIFCLTLFYSVAIQSFGFEIVYNCI
jgi:hypothetical protein